MVELSSVASEAVLVGGRYRIERLLGRGGMGTVHAALDTASGKMLALKRLPGSAAAREVALFEREYHTLRGLRHARIVEVYDYGKDCGGAFYTMELLTGGDLSSCAPIGWREVCRILCEVASILGVLHARRLVHRDLSPKNLWRLPDGHIKLIDFGALATFGVSLEVIGTPAFIPPEALRARPLDQRADLYALGALGYWLATSAHAYPANSMADLARVWQRAPAEPSSLAKLISEAQIEPIPRVFDALIGSLLRQDPAERPLNTEVLIDRLNAISGSLPESYDITVQGCLASKAFVGRLRERERVAELLRAARDGRGGAVLLESAPGMGRTRLLEELAIAGQFVGTLALYVDSSVASRPYGVASALALHLLNALPAQAADAAKAYARVLGHLSPELRQRLAITRPANVTDHAELRLRVQSALTQWLFIVSREQPLLLLLDDVGTFDDESAAWIAALAHELPKQRVLLIASAARERGFELPANAQRLGSSAQRMRLAPLAPAETYELLESVFGPVPYLPRFSDHLHRVSEGNPAHCLGLAEYLVRTGLVRYQEAMWVLPSELGVGQLPASVSDAYALRLKHVGVAARRLAQVLSLQKGSFSMARALALAEQPELARGAFAELMHRGVLLEADQGYRFAHEGLRDALLSELEPTRAARAHRRLGDAVLQDSTDPSERIRAAAHLLRGGERMQAERLVREGAKYYVDRDISGLGLAVPMLEELVELYPGQGGDAYSLADPLGLLAAAGYFVDRRLGARYGNTAIRTLTGLLRLELARKLRPWFGAKLALGVALGVAWIALALRRPRVPTLPSLLRLLAGAASALAGVAACCIDPKSAQRYADAIEPLAAFGPNHAAGFICRFTRALVLQVQDRPSATAHELRAMITRLESDRPIQEMPAHLRSNYLAGCTLALAITECWRDGQEGLKLADKLETYGPLYEMAADHLRASHYAAHGDPARAATYRERVERHAVQLRSAWQMDTWTPSDSTKVALRTQDPVLAKRAGQDLARLSLEIPSLELQARHARGTYHMLRGNYAQAIELLATDEAPASVVGWARARGSLARAHNGLGEHKRAREVCSQALAQLSPEDLQFPVMNLGLQIELALADAALGQAEAACARLDELIQAHRESHARLTLGALHEARAKVALLQGDPQSSREHLAHMESFYRPTGIATLVERCELLRGRGAQSPRPEVGHGGGAPLLTDDAHLITRIRLLLGGASVPLRERAQRALQVAIELTGADDGFVVLPHSEEALALPDHQRAPDRELVVWARGHLANTADEEATARIGELESLVDENMMTHGALHYCVTPLCTRHRRRDVVTGAIALGFPSPDPRLLAPEVLRILADALLEPS